MKHIRLNPEKRKMVRILGIITIVASLFMLLIAGFITFVHFDIPGQRIGCGRGFFRNEEDCRLVEQFGEHAVWVSKTILSVGAVITNVLDIIAAVLLRKMKMSGCWLYLVSFGVYLGSLVFAGLDRLSSHEITHLVPNVVMLFLYLSCLQNTNKPQETGIIE